MKCVICQGDDIRTMEVGEEIRAGNDIVVVPIHALVCGNCGERYYDRRTVRFLEEVEGKLKEGSAPLHQVGKVLAYG